MTLRLVFLACTVALVSWLWVRGTDNPSSLGPAPQLSSPAKCPNIRGAQSLARLLAFQTVSAANETEHLSEASIAAYEAMLESLEQELFPQVFTGGKLEVERVNNYSLLLTWNGSKPGLKPVLFVSHLDVVPATDVAAWTHGPFDAHVTKDGFLYGRGALDVKFSAAAILEAVTALLDQGYQPERTIMFGLGHDEEVGGEQGAGATAALLASRGIELEVVIDEGGLVMRDGLKPFTSQPVALVGTAEKGYVSAGVVLKTSGGHSSLPPTDGSDAHSVVLRYLAAVRRRQPGPGLKPPLTDMLDALQPYTRKPIILALMHLKNTWPFNHLVAHLMARGGREASAMVRTSLALTGMMGYVANNVLPPSVSLRFNARLYPGTPATAITDMLSAAAADSGVSAEVSVVERVWPAAGVTDSKGHHFNLLRQAIQEEWVYDGQPVPVVPFLLTGGTDSKHYAPLSRHGVLRFVPFDLSKSGGDLARIHGVDERVHEDTFTRAVCTYKRMLELFGQLGEAL